MTLTDAMMGAAALWLLFVLCGVPGVRTRTPTIAWEDASLARSASGADARIVPYSVWHQDIPDPRHVMPPLPDDDAIVANDGTFAPGASVPDNAYHALGAATIYAIGLPQVLSLTDVTIPPGGSLTLTNLGGSGLLVIEDGWLEMTERNGNTLLTRSPLAELPGPWEAESLPAIAPGDRISFGPGATIVLRNRGEHPARILAASVLARPGLAA